jgi:SSS family solute:Na+ symporter
MKEIIQLGSLDIGVIITYVVVLIAVAAWASYGGKKQGGNLFLANKSLGWFAIGLTMWGTNVGPSMLIANASSGYESGIVAGNFSWYAFPFIMLLAFVFAPRYLGAQVTTLPEYMGKRFGNSTRQYIAWYTLITILISWLGLTLFSGGVFMAQILNLPLWLCIVILVLFAASFAMAGGLKAIAFTNVYQMLLLIAVSVLLLVMAVAKAGGPAEIISSTPASYWKLFQPIGHPDFPWLAILLGYPIMGIWFWCTDQSMVQSVLGAKDLRQGQKGANFVAWLKLIDIPLFIIPGILAFILLPGLQNSTDSYMKLVEHVLPTGLIGLVVVVMTASLISTIGSALNSLSAVFTMDIYLKYFNQNADIKRIRGVGRLTVLAGALIAVFLAIGITKIQGLSFFNIFQSVLGFIAPPMSVAFLFAVLWKRTSREAVNLVLSLGTLFSLGTGILYYNKLILNGVHFLYVSFLIFILLSFFVIIYSIFRKKEIMQDENLPVFESIRPGKKVIVAWSLLVLVMLVMYLIFN